MCAHTKTTNLMRLCDRALPLARDESNMRGGKKRINAIINLIVIIEKSESRVVDEFRRYRKLAVKLYWFVFVRFRV